MEQLNVRIDENLKHQLKVEALALKLSLEEYVCKKLEERVK